MIGFLAFILWIAIGVVISKILGFYTKSTINRYGGPFLATVLLFGFAAGAHSYFMNYKKGQQAHLAGFSDIKDYEVAKSRGFETKSAMDAYETDKKGKEREARLQKQAKDKEKYKQKRVADEENCKKNTACWADKKWLAATFACDDLIEKKSNFAFEWTVGLLGVKFVSHKARANGVITYVGDKIKFQNNFGAWQNYIYECDFATEKETVLSVRVRP